MLHVCPLSVCVILSVSYQIISLAFMEGCLNENAQIVAPAILF